MRRPFALVCLCAAVLLLAGCQAPGLPPGQTEPGSGDVAPSEPAVDLGSNGSVPAAPEADRLGYENGYWYNESLSVTTDDGLNESERAAVVARTMARVERIRGLEFEDSVPVSVISRAEYRNSTGGEAGESLRRFDNTKFEALFFIGEKRDSIAVQNSNRGESVLGYYSSQRSEIVIVSDSETPTINRGTLAHELVHALQDQHFGLESDAQTRDEIQGRNGLIEGDAVAVRQEYTQRCGDDLECIDRPETSGGGGGDRHFGISFML
ncbi:MAG: Hvo_1808 family surface protein, partial [Haloarcula sp.]